jgi:hypothetical protein
MSELHPALVAIARGGLRERTEAGESLGILLTVDAHIARALEVTAVYLHLSFRRSIRYGADMFECAYLRCL